MDVNPGCNPDEENGEESVGHHGDQGELAEGDEDGEASHEDETGHWGMGPHPEVELLRLVSAAIPDN